MGAFAIRFALLLFVTACTANVEYDGWLNVRLQHAFGFDDQFTDRGNVSVPSLRSGNYFLDQSPLTPAQTAALKVNVEHILALSKTDGFYRLKSTVQALDGIENVFLSSAKADALISNKLNDAIRIWVLNNGAIASVGISTFTADSQEAEKSISKFNTQVFIHHIEQAPVPDTASFIQKLEREREAREKGEFKDNRSFFAKYWMYIVPIAIFVLISGAANPEQVAGR